MYVLICMPPPQKQKLVLLSLFLASRSNTTHHCGVSQLSLVVVNPRCLDNLETLVLFSNRLNLLVEICSLLNKTGNLFLCVDLYLCEPITENPKLLCNLVLFASRLFNLKQNTKQEFECNERGWGEERRERERERERGAEHSLTFVFISSLVLSILLLSSWRSYLSLMIPACNGNSQ